MGNKQNTVPEHEQGNILTTAKHQEYQRISNNIGQKKMCLGHLSGTHSQGTPTAKNMKIFLYILQQQKSNTKKYSGASENKKRILGNKQRIFYNNREQAKSIPQCTMIQPLANDWWQKSMNIICQNCLLLYKLKSI